MLAGAGSSTAALAFGGSVSPKAQTENWNGTNWTEVNDLSEPRDYLAGCGTSTNGRIFYNTNHSATYLDSPNTTSAVTYKVQLKVYGTSNSQRLNYNQNSSKSTILVMEVSA